MKCDLCGKTPQFGYTVSHSKRHVKRRWIPNIQPTNLTIGGEVRHLNLCTRCLRTQNKAAKA